MNKTDKLRDALKLMQKMGARFSNMKEAANKLAPLVGAKMVFEAFRQIPIVGDLMKFIDKVDAFVTKYTIGNIPILQWSNAYKKAGQNWFSGGDMKPEDYVNSKPNEGSKEQNNKEESGSDPQEGSELGQKKSEDNDISWYVPSDLTVDDLKIPANLSKSLSYDKIVKAGNTLVSSIRGIPKLAEIVLSPWECDNIDKIDDIIGDVYEALKGNLKSSLRYNKLQVKAWLFNNIALYCISKHLERKLCMRKFVDDQIPQEAWKAMWETFDLPIAVKPGARRLSHNVAFDAESDVFSQTINMYKELCSMHKTFVLPSHFKAWIDHYFGSLFSLDNDVANCKYAYLRLNYIHMYEYDADNNALVKSKISLSLFDASVPNLISLIRSFFNNQVNNDIYSDFVNARDVVRQKWSIIDSTDGWFTSYDDYKPVAIIDEGFKQALINGYTADLASILYNLSFDHTIRFDSVDGSADFLTTILFLGDLISQSPNAEVYPAKTLSILEVNMIIYANERLSVSLPSVMVNYSTVLTSYDSTASSDEIVEFTEPFAITFTSDYKIEITARDALDDTQKVTYAPYYVNLQYGYTPNIYKLDSYFEPLGNLQVRCRVFNSTEYGMSVYKKDSKYYCIIIPLCVDAENYLYYAVSKSNVQLDSIYEKKDYNTWGANFDIYRVDHNEEFDLSSGISVSADELLRAPDRFGESKTIFFILDADANTIKSQSTKLGSNGVISEGFAVSGFKLSILRTSPFWMFDITMSGTAEYQYQSEDSDPHQMAIMDDTLNILLYPTYQRMIADEEVQSPTLIVEGLLYLSYYANAFGYCIPLISRLVLGTSYGELSNTGSESLYTDKPVLNCYKEDYTPYAVSIDDLPYIIKCMYTGLFNIKGIPTSSDQTNKNE